jgi:hypothetical protein
MNEMNVGKWAVSGAKGRRFKSLRKRRDACLAADWEAAELDVGGTG